MRNGRRLPFILLSHTMHYGTGVFEGVRAYKTDHGPAIFRLQDHTDRLFEAACKLGIEIPYSPDELNQVQKGYFYKLIILMRVILDQSFSWVVNRLE